MNRRPVRTVSITSGKGGVGKTTMTVNMAHLLAKRGKKVLILDGDMSLANVDIFLKSQPNKNLSHFFQGEHDLKDILIKYTKNIHVLPGASGVVGMTQLDIYQKKMLMDAMDEFEGHYDYMLIDTASGITDEVLYLNSAAQEVIVVVQPDPASITDAYAMMKVLHQEYRVSQFSVLANQVLNEREGERIYQRINQVASKFLNVQIGFQGAVTYSLKVREASKNQKLITEIDPNCGSSLCLQKVVSKLDAEDSVKEMSGGLQFFWNQVLNVA